MEKREEERRKMKPHQLNPFVRYACLRTYYEPFPQNSICYDCRIFYIEKGEGSLYANGENFTFSKNFMIYLPPLTRYRFFFSDESEIAIYIMNFDLCDRHYDKPNSFGIAFEDTFDPSVAPDYTPLPDFAKVIVRQDMQHMQRYLTACTDAFLQKEEYYQEIASANLKLCLSELAKTAPMRGGSDLVNRVRSYIREHYEDVSLTNGVIAEHFSYHPYHLNRLMKEATGRSLHCYLLDYRTEMAKNLLTTTNDSISTVAEKAGFSSYSYFISRFKKQTGCSPKQYRKLYKNFSF